MCIRDRHKYDPDCEYCCENEFVKDAHEAVKLLPAVKNRHESAQTQLNMIDAKLQSLRPELIKEKLDKYNKITDKKNYF